MASNAKVTGNKILTFTLTGSAPLLMHNGQLADPLSPFAIDLKALTGKRKKTTEDLAEIGRLEWRGGLYYDETLGPVLPSDLVDSALVDGAKARKQGRDFKSTIFAVNGPYKLEYSGPRDEAGLWADERYRLSKSVRVGTARVMRCRPRFEQWSATVEIMILPGRVNPVDVREALETAGLMSGIGDWRPRYGRFSVK